MLPRFSAARSPLFKLPLRIASVLCTHARTYHLHVTLFARVFVYATLIPPSHIRTTHRAPPARTHRTTHAFATTSYRLPLPDGSRTHAHGLRLHFWITCEHVTYTLSSAFTVVGRLRLSTAYYSALTATFSLAHHTRFHYAPATTFKTRRTFYTVYSLTPLFSRYLDALRFA